MKIIDLLNKIAKGEEVPKKIRFDCTYWEKVCGEKYPYYIDDCDDDLFIYFFRKNLTFTLNDEVEIIEEEKEIEFEDIEELCLGDGYEYNKSSPQSRINQLIRNQKKLIDAVNELRREK